MLRRGSGGSRKNLMILVAGDLMIDVFVLPELHAAEQSSGLAIRGGGSAANTAAWIKFLDHDVTFVGCAGRDPRGHMLDAELREQGVEARLHFLAEWETGAVLVSVEQDGERIMRSARGANLGLSPEMIATSVDRPVDAIHLTGYSLLNRHGLKLLDAAARVAAEHGAFFSFDPSSEGAIRSVGGERLRAELARHRVDLLLPNEAEACVLAGCDEIGAAAERLAAVARAVAVKRGAGGALAAESGTTWAVATDEIRPVDSTGAGDAFNAAVLSSLLSGSALRDACSQGNRLARQVIGILGGRPAPR